jgi:hypothetical protein
MPLPYPNPPEVSPNQPEWPRASWKPILVCRHCGLGYAYTALDVEWYSAPNRDPLPQNSFLCFELQCEQKGCEVPVKIYLGMTPTIDKMGMGKRLESASKKVKCHAGHDVLLPLEIRKIETAIEIE